MKGILDWPRPLLRKFLLTGLIGIGCMIFSLVYYIYAQDRVLLILSSFLLVACFLNAFEIYRIVSKKNYEVVEGECRQITSKVIGRFKRVKIVDDNGLETTLRLNKNCRLIIGIRYRLYFCKSPADDLGSEYLNAVQSSNSFLGYEPAGGDNE